MYLFASTYLYEKTFSEKKICQVYVYRPSLPDKHLKSISMTVSTKLELQLHKILPRNHRYHNSH
jgi:hypothetical protein